VLFGGGCVGESVGSQVICLLATVLTVAIFARAILSWFQLDPRSPLVQILNDLTDPVLEPIRRVMPRLGMIDLSPLIAILLLQFVSRGLQQFLG
jgi:YggT family protein